MSGAQITGTQDGLVAAVAAVAGAMMESVVKSSMMLVSTTWAWVGQFTLGAGAACQIGAVAHGCLRQVSSKHAGRCRVSTSACVLTPPVLATQQVTMTMAVLATPSAGAEEAAGAAT